MNNNKPYHNPYLDMSVAATSKFAGLDKILFRWSIYLTQEESYRILDTMEIWAKSKYEGNFTEADNYDYLRKTLGQDRFYLIQMMERIDIKNAQEKLIYDAKQ